MGRAIRPALLCLGALLLLLALGFFGRAAWATALWPWPDGRLSFVFVASILAAIAAPLLWIGATGELGAASGGAINLFVTFAGGAGWLALLASRGGGTRILVTAALFAATALLTAGIWRWSRRLPRRDRRPVPAPVRASFALFAALLVPVGVALVARAPHIFPWPLHPDSSVLYGWIFLGAALYFIHGVVRPGWANAAGQLLGFLAYDLVLIGPFLAHFSAVLPEHRASLILYTAVLIYSGLLACFYLAVHPPTRLRPGPAAARAVGR